MLKFVMLGVALCLFITLPSRAALIGPGSEQGTAIGSIVNYQHSATMEGSTLFAYTQLKTQTHILSSSEQLIVDPVNPINWKWVATFVADLGSFDENPVQYGPGKVQTLPGMANRTSYADIFPQTIVVGIGGIPITWNYAEAGLTLNPVVFESETASYVKFPNAVTGPFVRQEVTFTGHFVGDMAVEIGSQYRLLNPVPEPNMAFVVMFTGLMFLGFARRAH